MSSYSIPLKSLRVIASSALGAADITEIRQAFFPDVLTNDDLQGVFFQPWITGSKPHPNVDKVLSTNARMPYNSISNDPTSVALGSAVRPGALSGPPPPSMHPLSGEWAMWRSASRSCVIKLDSIGFPKDAPDPLPVGPTVPVTLHVDRDYRPPKTAGLNVDQPAPFDHKFANGSSKYFGIKSGL
jgi:hypothetical protein